MASSTPNINRQDGIISSRLDVDTITDNFSDIHPPLGSHEALVASDRCYYCYDAPCVTACPTEIDIPRFIREISTGNTQGAAKTIFEQNIMGGMCARVCPTETLCEQACVRELAEGKPVQIGLLQRFATDDAMKDNQVFFEREPATGKKIAIIGAGPSGLACAHRLAVHGHEVIIFEAKEKAGGLNEFGIAAYKSVDDFATKEVDFITAIGGIEIRYGQPLGTKITIDTLAKTHDAVFLGMGLSGVNDLGLGSADSKGTVDAVDFISSLRQSNDKSDVKIGRRIAVIGGGMTAIDAAVQAKLLGAEEVTICYRRGQEDMNASPYEQELAATKGVVIRHWVQPKNMITDQDKVTAVELEYTQMNDGTLKGTDQTFVLEVDQVFSAIGQSFTQSDLTGTRSIELNNGRIKTDETGATSVPGIWAGGDCTDRGDDLTVTAVAQGRDAAESIHQELKV